MIHWIAHYNDGTALSQNEGGLTYHDIDRDKLIAFSLFYEQKQLLLIDLEDDTNGDSNIGPKRLIWRIRGQLNASGRETKVHMVGWQRKVNGKNVQAICYVTESGTVVLSGQWQENKPMLHAPALREFELA